MAMIKGTKVVTICIVKWGETYYFESSILDLHQGNDLQLLICCHSFLEVALCNLAESTLNCHQPFATFLQEYNIIKLNPGFCEANVYLHRSLRSLILSISIFSYNN